MPKKIPKSTLDPLTDEQVHEIALGILRNEIFTDRHIAPGDQARNMLVHIFMPLGLLDKKQILALQRKQRPGIMYAYMKNAGPRAINGYPMFFEVAMASQTDAAKVWTKYKELTESIGHDAQA